MILWHAIEVIESCLSAPADVERGSNVGASPVKDFLYLWPVLHVLILHGLDRSSRHNHAVKLLLAQFLEVLIEHHHVLYRCILRCMALQLHEVHLQLQRRIGEQTNESVSVVILSGMRLSIHIFNGRISWLCALLRSSQRYFHASAARWLEAYLVILMAYLLFPFLYLCAKLRIFNEIRKDSEK